MIPREPKKIRPCMDCGAPSPMGRLQTRCAPCGKIAMNLWRIDYGKNRRRSERKPHVCPECKKEFLRGQGNRKYCSEECRKQAHPRIRAMNDKRQEARDSNRNIKLKKAYGITLQEKRNMIEKQGGRCPICNSNYKSERYIHIDHCHKTGKIRDVICGLCNVGLGAFKDSIENLKSAVSYLEKHRT